MSHFKREDIFFIGSNYLLMGCLDVICLLCRSNPFAHRIIPTEVALKGTWVEVTFFCFDSVQISIDCQNKLKNIRSK